MGEDIDALFGPVGVAEHGVALAVLVDHEPDRLIGDGADFGVERLCQDIGRAGIDDYDPVTGDDEAEAARWRRWRTRHGG